MGNTLEQLGYEQEIGNNPRVRRYKLKISDGVLIVAFNLDLKIWRHYKFSNGIYTSWGTSVALHVAITKKMKELGFFRI